MIGFRRLVLPHLLILALLAVAHVSVAAEPCADPTVEIHCDHPDIVAKAAELGTPLAIYKFVRNTIEYEVYYGSKKGALGALWSRSGNDYDQASLLIALLRAAGYNARYAIGMVNIHVDQLEQWSGIRDGQTAIRYFHFLYCLRLSLGSDGDGPCAADPKRFNSISPAGVIVERAWVEVELPRNYRALDVGDSDPAWVPLDPSWKQKDYPGDADVVDVPIGDEVTGDCGGKVCFDYDQYYSKVDPRLPSEIWDQEIREYLAENHPGKTHDEVIHDGPIIPYEGEVLPSSLEFYPEPENLAGSPPTVGVVQTSDLGTLPGDVKRRYEVSISRYDRDCIPGNCYCDFDHYYYGYYYPCIPPCDECTYYWDEGYWCEEDDCDWGYHYYARLYTAELVGKRLTLSYFPTDTAREDFLRNGGYLGGWPESEDYDSLLEYCVNELDEVRCEGTAQIKLGGEWRGGSNDPEIFGTKHAYPFRIERDLVPGASETVEYSVTAGSFNVISVDVNQMSGEKIQERIDRLVELFSTLPLVDEVSVTDDDDDDPNQNGIPGELLIDQSWLSGPPDGVITPCSFYALECAMTSCDIAVTAQLYLADDLIGELLHLAGLRYFQRLREETKRQLALDGFVALHTPHVGRVSSGIKFSYLFDRPVGVEPGSPSIDVKGYSIALRQIDGASTPTLRREGRLMSHVASALEHQVWEELVGADFVSTVKGIQLVRERFPAQPVQHDRAALDTFQFGRVSSEIRDAIGAAVAGGAYVVAPIGSVTDQGDPLDVYYEETPISDTQSTHLMAIAVGGQTFGGACAYPCGSTWYSPVDVFYDDDPLTDWVLDYNLGFGDSGRMNTASAYDPYLVSFNTVGDPVSMISGNLHHSEEDLRIPGDGPDFVLTRTYNSRVEEAGVLGHGWSHSYEMRVQPVRDEQEFIYLPTAIAGFYQQDECVGVRSDTLDSSNAGTSSTESVTWAALPTAFRDHAQIDSIELELAFEGEFTVEFDGPDGTGQPDESLHAFSDSTDFKTIELRTSSGEPYADLSSALELTLRDFESSDRLHYARLRVAYRGPAVKRRELQSLRFTGWLTEAALRDSDPSTCSATNSGVATVQFEPVGCLHELPAGGFGFELFTSVYRPDPQYESRLWRGTEGSGEAFATGPNSPSGAQMHLMTVDESPDPQAYQITFDDDYFDAGSGGVQLCHLQYRVLWMPQEQVDVVTEDGSRLRFTQPLYGAAGWIGDPGVRDKLTEDANGFELIRPDGSRVRFDEEIDGKHYVTKISDAQGRSLDLAYENGLLKTVTDDTEVETSGGSIFPQLVFDYDSDGYLETVTDWTSRVWEYDVQDGNLVEAKDPIQVESGLMGTRYEYGLGPDAENPDLAHNVTRIVFPKDAGDHWVTFEYYGSDRVLAHTDSLGNRQTFLYNMPRLESQTIDPRGFTTVYRHDRQGNLIQRVDPDGATWEWEYDDDRNVTAEIDPFGFRREFVYDEEVDDRGNPAEIKDRDGRSTFYTYDAVSGAPATITDKRGNVRTTTYTDGLPEDVSGTIGGVDTLLQTHEYDPASHRLDRTLRQIEPGSSRQGTTRYLYYPGNRDIEWVEEWEDVDGDGALVVGTDELLRKAHYEYDDLGRVTEARVERIDDPDGLTQVELVTGFAYNLRGELERLTQPDGTVRVSGYDENGNLEYSYLEETLPKPGPGGSLVAEHQRLDYDYDALDRLVSVTDALGRVTRFEYDEMGNRTATIDPAGNVTRVEYDSMGRPVRTVDANGAVSEVEYDLAGRVVATTDATGVTTTQAYDEVGRLVAVQLGDSEPATRTVVYGSGTPAPYQEELRDPNGNPPTVFEFDDLGRVFKVTDAESGESFLGHDFFSNLTSFKDPAGATSSFGYDALGRQVTADYPWADASRTTKYDETGNPVRITKADGCRIDLRYDLMGRLLRRTSDTGTCDGSVDDRFGYDARGNLVAARNAHVGLIRQYDALDRLTREVDDRFGTAVQYQYDVAGRLSARVYPDGSVVHVSHDPAGRPIGISDPFGDTTSYVYDAAGRRTQTLSHKTGLRTNLGYDDQGRLARIESFRWDGSAGPWRGYPAYDDAGNRTQMTDQAGTTGYSYDALHRLASVDPPAPGSADTIHYEYDAAGNRLHSGLKSGETWVSPYFTYYYSDGGVAGRLTHRLEEATDGATGVTLEGFPVYDANGNPTLWSHQGSPERALTWDALDRLIAIGEVEFNASYVYDPLGRRIEKTEQGETTRYQYDGLDVVAEYDGSSALQARYLFGPGIDEPLKVARGGVVAAYHSDGIGSILSLTEIGGSAAELASYDYDAFGVLDDGGGSFDNAYTYTGRERDASGLYYYRARYYLASVGRFLTPDPMGLAGGVNPYAYVGSNPVNYRDPFGLVAFAGGSSFDNAVSPPAPPALSFSSEGINSLVGGVLDRALLGPFRSQSLRDIGASALSSCHSTECSSAFGDLIAADEQRARNMLGATVAVASFLPDLAAIPTLAAEVAARATTTAGLSTSRALSLERVVNPNTIRFTQDSISNTFRSGLPLRDAIYGLRTGVLETDSFAAIRVFERKGVPFTLDNRRLFVFQEAGVPIRTVPALASDVAAEAFKFTTRNEGLSILVRGGL